MEANRELYFNTSAEAGRLNFAVDVLNRENFGVTLHDRLNKSSSVPHCFVGWSTEDRQLLQEAIASSTASAHCQIFKHPEVLPTLWLKPMDEVSLVSSFQLDRQLQYRLVFNIFIFDKPGSLLECAQCAEAHTRGIYDGSNSRSGNRRLPSKIGIVYAKPQGADSDWAPAHFGSALMLLTSSAQYVRLNGSDSDCVLGLLPVSLPAHSDSARRLSVSVPFTVTCLSSHTDRGSKRGICVTVCLETAPAGSFNCWQVAGRFAFRIRAVASPYRDLMAEVFELLSLEQIGCPAGCGHAEKTRHQSTKLPAGVKRRLPPDEDASNTSSSPPPPPPPPPAPAPPAPPSQPAASSQEQQLQQLVNPVQLIQQILSFSFEPKLTCDENSSRIVLDFPSPMQARYAVKLINGQFEILRHAQQHLLCALTSGLATPPAASQASSDSSGNPMLGDPMLSVPLIDSFLQQQQQQPFPLRQNDTIDLLKRILSNSSNVSDASGLNLSFRLSQELQNLSQNEQQQQQQQHLDDRVVAEPAAAEMPRPTDPVLSHQPTIILTREPSQGSVAAAAASAAAPEKARLASLSTEAAGSDEPQQRRRYPEKTDALLGMINLKKYSSKFSSLGVHLTKDLARMSTAQLTSSTDGPAMSLQDAQKLRRELDDYLACCGEGSGGGGAMFQLERLTPSTGDSLSSCYRPGGLGVRRSPRQSTSTASSTSTSTSKRS